MIIGVIAIQGNVEEHIEALERALNERGERDFTIRRIKRAGIVPECDAVVIPGGESTTLGRLMKIEGVDEEIRDATARGVPVMGTCAGLILLSKHGDRTAERTGQSLLGLMDTWVLRNAFGRQQESFETPLQIPALGNKPFHAVFIRAPAITRTGKNVETLAAFNEYTVAARQKNLLAIAFHPELTGDSRFHHYFLDTCRTEGSTVL